MLSYCMTPTGVGGGGLCEEKCLGNKKALFCQSWKMVLALFLFSPLLQRSPRKLLTLTEEENMIYDDIMYYPSKSVLRKIVFYGVLK